MLDLLFLQSLPRSGTALTFSLLATANDILFERQYPYEHLAATYFVRASRCMTLSPQAATQLKIDPLQPRFGNERAGMVKKQIPSNPSTGLSTYHAHRVYAPGLFALIEAGLGWVTKDSIELAKGIVALLLVEVVAYASWLSNCDLAGRCFLVVAGLFLLSPTAFPWYYCWVLAMVPLQNRLSWMVLGLLVPINYVDFHSAGNSFLSQENWAGFYATQVVVWGGFLGACLYERQKAAALLEE